MNRLAKADFLDRWPFSSRVFLETHLFRKKRTFLTFPGKKNFQTYPGKTKSLSILGKQLLGKDVKVNENYCQIFWINIFLTIPRRTTSSNKSQFQRAHRYVEIRVEISKLTFKTDDTGDTTELTRSIFPLCFYLLFNMFFCSFLPFLIYLIVFMRTIYFVLSCALYAKTY